MRNFGKLSFLICLLGLVAACASGPRFKEVSPKISPLAKNRGRIFFYRKSSLFGAGLSPSVKLNGKVAGEASSGTVFYTDVTPGEYTVETSTEATKSMKVTVGKGQIRYVRFSVSMGVATGHVNPDLVEPSEAEREVQDLHYAESKPPK